MPKLDTPRTAIIVEGLKAMQMRRATTDLADAITQTQATLVQHVQQLERKLARCQSQADAWCVKATKLKVKLEQAEQRLAEAEKVIGHCRTEFVTAQGRLATAGGAKSVLSSHSERAIERLGELIKMVDAALAQSEEDKP